MRRHLSAGTGLTQSVANRKMGAGFLETNQPKWPIMHSSTEPLLADGFRYMRGHDPLLDAIARVEREATKVAKLDQLTAWVRGPLRDLIPHEKALLGFGVVGYSTIRLDFAHPVDLAEAYFSASPSGTQNIASPVMVKWLERREPQTFGPAGFCRLVHERWLDNLRRHQIDNGILDASVESGTGRLAFIKLFNVGVSPALDANVLRQCVTPLLAEFWKHIEAASPGIVSSVQPRPTLTAAELKVLQWLREGKTNWEIGRILGKSELTVKTQIQHMLRKTRFKSRHVLVASDY